MRDIKDAMPVPSRKVAYMWMDAARAIAAILVVLGHVRDHLVQTTGVIGWSPFLFITGLAHEAVIVFFVLSGYWIGRSVFRDVETKNFWRDYIIARCTRLYIVLIPAIALTAALDFIGSSILQLPFYDDGGGSLSFHGFDDGTHSLKTLFGNLAYLQFAIRSYGSNSVLWSISFEFWFYMWFPAVLLAARGRYRVVLLSLLFGFINPSLFFYFLIWGLGVCMFLLDKKMSGGEGQRKFIGSWVYLIVALFLMVLSLLASDKVPVRVSDLMLGFTTVAVFLGLLQFKGKIIEPFYPIATYGKYASYSLYATHFPISIFIAASLESARRPIGINSVFLVFFVVLTCIVVSLIFAHLTEARTGQIKEKIEEFFLR
jgi:peptidoglycan/LPS O-acetylase OafA/YrhL